MEVSVTVPVWLMWSVGALVGVLVLSLAVFGALFIFITKDWFR